MINSRIGISSKLALCIISLWTADARGFDHAHSDWGAVLKRFVSGPEAATRVDYAGLKRDSAMLDRYLSGLSKTSRKEFDTWSTDLQLAFLINAYNAFTLKLVIDHHPVKSIRDIGAIFRSAWKKKFFRLLDDERHLDWIEHDMIRVRYPEPRIHFALSCASIGCPPLLKEPYVGVRLTAQLEKATVSFIRNPERNRFDPKSGALLLSKIFDWYGKDFDTHATSVRAFVARRMGSTEEERQRIFKAKELDFLDYDWGLNEVNSARR